MSTKSSGSKTTSTSKKGVPASWPPVRSDSSGANRRFPTKFIINVDGSQVSVAFKEADTIRQVLERICEERRLDFKAMEPLVRGSPVSLEFTLGDIHEQLGVNEISYVPAVSNDSFLVLMDGNVRHLVDYTATQTLANLLQTVALSKSLNFDQFSVVLKDGTPIPDTSITLSAFVQRYSVREVGFFQKGADKGKAQQAQFREKLNLPSMRLEPKVQSDGRVRTIKDVDITPLHKTIENLKFAAEAVGKDPNWNNAEFWGNSLQ